MPVGGAGDPELAGDVGGDADGGGGRAPPIRARHGVRQGDGRVGQEGELNV